MADTLSGGLEVSRNLFLNNQRTDGVTVLDLNSLVYPDLPAGSIGPGIDACSSPARGLGYLKG